MFRSLLPLLLLLGLVAQATAADKPRRASPVTVAEAVQQTLAPLSWYSGTVISRHDARLAAEVEGRLESVADVGTRVAKGDELARLDDTFIQTALAEERASVSRAQAQLEFFSAEVKRLQRLAKQNNAALSQLEQTISDRKVARSDLQAAQARVANAEKRLERSVIRAPFPGVVTERLLDAGEWADSGAAVVRLVGEDDLEVQTWVPAHTLPFLQPGTTLDIDADIRPLEGTVSRLVSVGDDRSRLYELRITVTDAGWQPGRSVRVAVPVAAARSVVAIPRDALVLRRSGISVYRVLEDDTADRVPVSTGIAQGDLIEVQGAIQAGDRVVVRGGERLQPGSPVTILPAKSQP